MTINVHFNVSVTSRDLQTSRLGLVSVSAIDVSCPSLFQTPNLTFKSPKFIDIDAIRLAHAIPC